MARISWQSIDMNNKTITCWGNGIVIDRMRAYGRELKIGDRVVVIDPRHIPEEGIFQIVGFKRPEAWGDIPLVFVLDKYVGIDIRRLKLWN